MALNRLINLAYVGAISLTVGTLTLGVGLLRAGLHEHENAAARAGQTCPRFLFRRCTVDMGDTPNGAEP